MHKQAAILLNYPAGQIHISVADYSYLLDCGTAESCVLKADQKRELEENVSVCYGLHPMREPYCYFETMVLETGKGHCVKG